MTENLNPRENINEERYIAGFCKRHGWFSAALKNSNTAYTWPCPLCSIEKKSLSVFGQTVIPERYKNKNFNNYFCECSGQQIALAKCENFLKVKEQNPKSGDGLVLLGSVGTGKTHLACSILTNFVMSQRKSCFYTTAEKLVTKIISTWSQESEKTQDEMTEAFSSVELLVIDELGAYKNSDREMRILSEIINERYARMKSTIFCTNLKWSGSRSLESYLDERSFDRIYELSELIVFEWPSYRGKK